MVDKHDTDIAVSRHIFHQIFVHQIITHHVQKIDTFFMTGEEWTEPTQQTDLATKATLLDADDRAEKATAR